MGYLARLRRAGLLDAPRELPFAAPVMADRLAQLRAMPYREYRRSPGWGDTRALALTRARRTCQADPAHFDGVDVHHVSRDRIGAEHAGDLRVLCAECAGELRG